MHNELKGDKADKSQIPNRETDKVTEKEAADQSEETNMNNKKGYNETDPDAPVNPDDAAKKKAKKQ